MGITYTLVNLTKHEQVDFGQFWLTKSDELLINPIAGTIVMSYMLSNQGDHISFVPEAYTDLDLTTYPNVIEHYLTELIDAGWILDTRAAGIRDLPVPECYQLATAYRQWRIGRESDAPFPGW